MDKNYVERRKNNYLTRYKVGMRTRIVMDVLRQHYGAGSLDILDAGCCDGAMLREIKRNLNVGRAVGIDAEEAFLRENDDAALRLLPMDMEKQLQFEDGMFDAVIVSSVLEHLSNAGVFIGEARRILRERGLLVILSVIPWCERLLCSLNLKNDDHQRNYSRKELEGYLAGAGFSTISVSKTLHGSGYQVLVARK